MRNVWGEIDVAREAGYTVPFTITDPGPDRTTGTADDQRFQTLALAPWTGQDRVFTNLGERGNADFQNVEFALNRRMSGRWMLLTSLGMTWSTMAHTQGGGRYGNTTFPYRPADRLMGDDGIETSTLAPTDKRVLVLHEQILNFDRKPLGNQAGDVTELTSVVSMSQ